MDYTQDNDNLDIELAIKKFAKEEKGGQLTVDVYQTAKEIIVQSTVAGTDPNTVDISVTKDMVIIRGSRESEEEIAPSDYYYQEIYWGSFSRSIILPVDIDPDRSKATMKNGVLTIRLPKIIS